jgi:hypothetical protein
MAFWGGPVKYASTLRLLGTATEDRLAWQQRNGSFMTIHAPVYPYGDRLNK